MEPGRTRNVKAVLLAIYLNDHLAGATAGRELARRSAASNRASSYGSFLADLAVQISEDRQSLIELMGALDVRIDRSKDLALLIERGQQQLSRLESERL